MIKKYSISGSIIIFLILMLNALANLKFANGHCGNAMVVEDI